MWTLNYRSPLLSSQFLSALKWLLKSSLTVSELQVLNNVILFLSKFLHKWKTWHLLVNSQYPIITCITYTVKQLNHQVSFFNWETLFEWFFTYILARTSCILMRWRYLFCTRPTWILIVLVHWNNSRWVTCGLTYSATLSWLRANQISISYFLVRRHSALNQWSTTLKTSMIIITAQRCLNWNETVCQKTFSGLSTKCFSMNMHLLMYI